MSQTDTSRAKWNMIIDVALCENCHNCTLATKDEHVGNSFPGYAAEMPRHGHDWIQITRKVRGSGHMVDTAYLPTMCNHCDDAPCVAAGGGCIKKRDDGLVLIDPVQSKGRRDLVDACPYGQILWNEVLDLPQHWTFDAHLLDKGWKEPRASQACPTGALRAAKVTDSEMVRIAETEGLETLPPEQGARPRVYYKNLHRFRKCFLGGSVIAHRQGQLDCVEGASVELLRDGIAVAGTATDTFGDFKFDGLEPDGAEYEVRVSGPSGTARAVVALTDTVVLPDMTVS